MKNIFIILITCFLFLKTSGYAQTNKNTVYSQLITLNDGWKNNKADDSILKETIYLNNDVELIQLHLSLIEEKLRARNNALLTEAQIKNRNECLDILHNYWVKGTFPKNIYHHERTPYFIDHLGTACAVGQLLISTNYAETAIKISEENNYAYVSQLNKQYPELKVWANKYGFTIDELAWIQPGYDSDPYYSNIICDSSCSQPGDTTTSSFLAPDSIKMKYIDDAQQVALNWIYAKDLIYKDSINIPQTYIDTVLKTLIAIHNSINLTARDTVIEMIKIHSSQENTPENNNIPEMNNFYIRTDGTLPWMVALENGATFSGVPAIDSLIVNYGVQYESSHWANHSNNIKYYRFKTTNNYNIRELVKLIDTVSNITTSQYQPDFFDSYEFLYHTDITSFQQFSDHSEITFYFKGGPCQMFPCDYRKYACEKGRYWDFKVSNNSIVTFVRSYGSPLQELRTPSSIEKTKNINEILIYPNPFTNNISIKGLKPDKYNYDIYNSLGTIISSGFLTSNEISNLNNLPQGQYFIRLYNDKTNFTKFIIKQ